MNNIEALEQAVHGNAVTPALVESALIEARNNIAERTMILSQTNALDTEIAQLDQVITGVRQLAQPAPAAPAEPAPADLEAAGDEAPATETLTDGGDA